MTLFKDLPEFPLWTKLMFGRTPEQMVEPVPIFDDLPMVEASENYRYVRSITPMPKPKWSSEGSILVRVDKALYAIYEEGFKPTTSTQIKTSSFGKSHMRLEAAKLELGSVLEFTPDGLTFHGVPIVTDPSVSPDTIEIHVNGKVHTVISVGEPE